MTISNLPEITLTCRDGHLFTTRAKGGITVQCKTCGAPKRVPVNRPRTAREMSAATARREDQDPADEMAARWAAEPARDGGSQLRTGRDSDTCQECGTGLLWEPGRTVVYCPDCQTATLPAAVTGHYERQAHRSAEVAVRAAPDRSAERAARVRLRAIAQRMADHVNGWLDTLDTGGLSGNAERAALDYRAELTAHLPEIRDAESEAELAAIAADITEVTDRAVSSGAVAAIAEQREAAERAEQWRERERQAAAQAQRDQRDQERQAALAERAAPRVIQGHAEQLAITGPASNLVTMAGPLLKMAGRREARIERNGRCEFPHTLMRAAATRQVTGTRSAYWDEHETDVGAVRCCDQHQADAITYIANLGWPYYIAHDISRPGAPRVLVQ
jgi:hypothetical protein